MTPRAPIHCRTPLRATALGLALLLCTGLALARAEDEAEPVALIEHGCSVLFEQNGRSGTQDTQELRVLDLGDDMQFHGFEADDDKRVTGVICRRNSVLPAMNDYQVPQAGYPLGLIADDRNATLELDNGRYRFHVTDGPPLTRREQAEVDRTLATYPKPAKKQ
jgi:hypothetical protein